MNNFAKTPNMSELTIHEMAIVSGGESGWYYLGRAAKQIFYSVVANPVLA